MYREDIRFPIKDTELREDVHALGAIVGETIRDQGGDKFFEIVEGDRRAAIARREGADAGAGDSELEGRTAGREPASATDLTRAFSLWFQAVNTAEKVHRVRRRRQYLNDSSTAQPGGIADCISRLQREGLSLEQTLALIASMSIEPVFAAHPTESTRRTILRKQQRIAQDLLERLNPSLIRSELDSLWARVRLEVASIWQTEEHPSEGLTVADYREHVLFYLIEVLYRVVPLFYEEIEAAVARAYGVAVESLDVPSILHFGSWVGSDMDGNAEVHGKTIRETLRRHRQLIVSSYYTECGQLAETLSQSASRVRVSAALAERIDAYSALLPGAQALAPARHDRMPYRIYFGQIGQRLKATYEGNPNAYQSPEELLADVQLAADSLAANRGRHAGYFLVRRLIRRVRTFGFHLATLDVIQFAHVHDEVIAQGLGVPQWPTLPPAERLRQLRDLLARDQGPTAPLDAVGRRTLWVFEAIVHAQHRIAGRAIGAYIVSGAEGPEDVLAALLLGALGRCHRQAHRRMSPRRGAPARFGRLAGERRPVVAQLERRAGISPSSRGAGQSPMGGDRILRQQQAGRHSGVALVIAGRAASAVGSLARHRDHDHDFSRTRRYTGARRGPHRALDRSGAGWRDSRCVALDRAG